VSDRIVVVGSGASGVHFALTLLEQGRNVLMLDVGHVRPPAVAPELSLDELKTQLPDPVAYFLGEDFESLVLPGNAGEYYGFPPSKSYVFTRPERFEWRTRGFAPLASFAQGGLAEVWTGGSYPFNDAELGAFPFGYGELGPCYGEVARRIGITGAADDLSRFFPLHDHLLEPLRLDEHSARLLADYERHRSYLNERLGAFLGRARVAVLSRDLDGRRACSYTGRCLWGCPSGALYTPSLTLEACRRHPAFEYLNGVEVTHFRFTSANRVSHVVARPLAGGPAIEIETPVLALAAGTLSSARIFLESIWRDSGEIVCLRGLMDNRQILMPFVNLHLLGRPFDSRTYQYHQLAIGMAREAPLDYVHGLVTTLKTAMIHPVAPSLPLALRGAISIFRNLHAALGLVNINFSDYRRQENLVALERASGGGARLLIEYSPPPGEADKLRRAMRDFRRFLLRLGCLAPPPMTHIRPMGASVHYAGLLPMSRQPQPLTTSPEGRSHDFDNLYFVDGTTFPALPAKNLTFTLMANAVRIARRAFG